MNPQQRREQWQSILVGLAVTAAVALVYLLGDLDWLELKTLDLRFLYANSMPESGNLVCIDLDDASIGRIGRWPWPRDVQAGILDVLGEVGVKALLVDLTLGEPEPLRSILPRQADIAFDPLALATTRVPIALPDLAVRAAIEDVGPVYLAFNYSAGTVWKDVLASDDFARVLAAMETGPADAAQRLAESLRPRPVRPGEPPWDPWLWARLVNALQSRPTRDEDALAQQLDVARKPDLVTVIAACREAALRRGVQRWLETHPSQRDDPPHTLFDALDAELINRAPRYQELLAVALRDALSLQATLHSGFPLANALAPAAPAVDALAPVYFLHARAAKRCGFVVFDPDRDGVMRRTRLLVQHAGRVMPQLAFAIALDQLGCGPADITAEPGRLIIKRPNNAPPLAVQLDDDARVQVPWLPQRDWSRQFGQHVPVDAPWQVFDRRGSIAANEQHILELLAQLAQDGQLGDLDQYREDLATRLKLENDLRAARYRGDHRAGQETQALLTQARRLLAEDEPTVQVSLARAQAALKAVAEPSRTSAQTTALAALHEIEQAQLANVEYRAEIDQTLAWLRARIQGKIGLLGYTATSLADMTPIPTHRRAPGVVAHANLLNGLLTGRTVSWAPKSLNLALAAALGLLSTLASARWGPRTAGLVGLLIAAYVSIAGGLAFYVWTYWIALTPAMAAPAAAYVAVVVHRYLFLERERRQLTTALSQYTSATLARKMAEDAELCRRAETREVSAMFTDLAGFTSLSERIGAERTQRVLNVSLGRFSDAILRHEGMINKFIGDGVFAFWNPVIYPQPDHAVRACETAVDLQAALRGLIDEQRRGGGDEAFAALEMRIGVATGNAVVGPCGSEQKYDYTCIGDSVNVASRLESANKFFGTHILISGATQAALDERFVLRPLGGVQVKGKTQGVPVYEILGRPGDVPAEWRAYAGQFAVAVAAFQQRRWGEALSLFEACLQQRPDDLAAARYAAMVRQLAVSPPGEDWNGALELTEK